MPSKGLQEPLIKSYEQILNFIIRKFKRYFPLEKRLKKIIVGKGEFIDEKGVSDPQKRSEELHCDGCVTYCVTKFIFFVRPKDGAQLLAELLVYVWQNKNTKNLTKKCDISRRKFKNIESPKMVSFFSKVENSEI